MNYSFIDISINNYLYFYDFDILNIFKIEQKNKSIINNNVIKISVKKI